LKLLLVPDTNHEIGQSLETRANNKKLFPPSDILIDEAQPYQNRWDIFAEAFDLPKVDWNSARDGKPDPRE